MTNQHHFSPELHSTPTHENSPDPQVTEHDESIAIPCILDSLSCSDSSASLQSWSDLDNFLPFAVSDTSNYSLHNSSPDPDHNNLPDYPIQPVPLVIPVVINVHPPHHNLHSSVPRAPIRQIIRRDNRAVTALSLPNVMVTNHRSIFPKFNNLVDELLENEMHLGLHSEIWEDKEKAAHANTIEEALEIHGIQYISTPRPNRRGGGALLVRAPLFLLSWMHLPCLWISP